MATAFYLWFCCVFVPHPGTGSAGIDLLVLLSPVELDLRFTLDIFFFVVFFLLHGFY